MRKPNDKFTPAEEQAINAEVARLAEKYPESPIDTIRSTVILRQVQLSLIPIYEFLGFCMPKIDPGHCYWLAQELEVYQRIDEVAGRPLSERALELIEKYGLKNNAPI